MSDNEIFVTCAVVACPNNYPGGIRDDLTYHRFPNDAAMKAAWIKACMRPRHWVDADSSYVCSDHFDGDDFQYSETDPHALSLKPDAIPSARIAVKAEPIDVEEDFQGVLDDETYEMVLEATTEGLANDSDQYDQGHFVQDGSQFLGGHRCKKCGRVFKTNGRLTRHEYFCSPTEKKPKIGPRANSGTPCFYKCGAKFYHRNKMLKHMELVHQCVVDQKQKLRFANMEEFWTWKENEEERTYSYFPKRSGNHKNTAMYQCQRDGPSRAKSNADERSRAGKRQIAKGPIKENIVCLAHIKTTLNDDGTVTALYFPSHNHPLSAMDYLHHPLSRATQMFIKEKLELGYTPKQIADELLTRQTASGSDNPMTKNQFLHMVNKLDRIRGFLDRERRRVKEKSSGETSLQRKRRSRKAIFEEQFQKSKQFQEEVKANRRYLLEECSENDEDVTLDASVRAMDVSQNSAGDRFHEGDDFEDGVFQRSEDEEEHSDNLMEPDDLVRTLDGASAIVCKKEEVIQELILNESGISSSSQDIQSLYKDTLQENRQLKDTVYHLKNRIVKKDRQINLLINALKKSLSRESPDLASLKETVSDGDYEIIVI